MMGMESEQEERLKAVSAGLRFELERLEAAVSEGLSGLRRDAALRAQIDEERVETFARERAAWERAVWEERAALDREYRTARLEMEKVSAAATDRILARLADMKDSQEALLAAVRESHAGWREALEASKEKPAAKDEQIAGLKSEVLELAQALKEKEESFLSYADQRKGFDRQMQDRIMSLERELNDEKRRALDFPAKSDGLEIKVSSLSEQLRVAQEALKERVKSLGELAEERERLLKALKKEADQRQRDEAERQESVRKLGLELAAEMARNEAAAKEIKDLRADLESGRTDLEAALRAGAEREELAKSLREKEELLRLVHGAFQGLGPQR